MKKYLPIPCIVTATMLLNGCSVVPGMHVERFNEHSTNELPVANENSSSIRNIEITPITASLIVEQEKDIHAIVANTQQRYYQSRTGADRDAAPETPYYQYRIGPRDVLTIIVWDHPELTIPAGQFRAAEAAGTLVGEDGTIFYPYAGIIQAAGKTMQELRTVLTKRLSKYIENVQMDIRIAAFRSQRTYITGKIKQPGIHTLSDIPLTVVEIVNRSGGFDTDADLRNITLTREGKTYRVDLRALYENGDASQNVLLQKGDVVHVPDRKLNKIFVLGEVVTPKSFIMDNGRMTLNEAIHEAEGVKQDTSDPAQIFVFRGGVGKPQMFHLNAKAPDALLLADRFALQPRDVIYVDTAEGIRWNRVIAQIQPTASLLSTFSGTRFPLFSSPNGR